MSKLLFDTNEWTIPRIENTWNALHKINDEKYQFDIYEPQLEIIDYDTMLIKQAVSVGMPISYSHWSYGKHYLQEKQDYVNKKSGTSYEMIINSDPCIAYLMDTNTMAMQALVLAHASVGHSCFFKTNYEFKNNISAKFIIPFLEYSTKYIEDCERNWGVIEVEELLDYLHAIANYGVDDIYDEKRSDNEERIKKMHEYNAYIDENYNELYKDFDLKLGGFEILLGEGFRTVTESNLLYFIEKNAFDLLDWERQIIKIIRIREQYFKPQIKTKLMNEGFASFCEYLFIHDLYNEGYIHEGTLLELLNSHCNVCYHPDYHILPGHLNPYKLGMAIFMDIKRICIDPTEEDKKLYPDFAGCQDWLSQIKYVVENFNDESFILQYLSPKVIKDLKLMELVLKEGPSLFFSDDEEGYFYEVSHVSDPETLNRFRKNLSLTYTKEYFTPQLKIMSYHPGDSELHMMLKDGLQLNREVYERDAKEVTKYIKALMGGSLRINLLREDYATLFKF